MSNSIIPRTSTTSVQTSIDQSFELGSLVMAIAQSNYPVQEEIQKGTLAFARFAEEMKSSFQALAQENAKLREQIAESEMRNREGEAVHQAERRAADAKVAAFLAEVKLLKTNNEKLQTELNSFKNQVASSNTRINELNDQLDAMKHSLKQSNHQVKILKAPAERFKLKK